MMPTQSMLMCLYILMRHGALTLFIDLHVNITRKLIVLIQGIFTLRQMVLMLSHDIGLMRQFGYVHLCT